NPVSPINSRPLHGPARTRKRQCLRATCLAVQSDAGSKRDADRDALAEGASRTGDLMPAPRSHWWVSRDAQRLVSRCEFSAGKAIDVAELRHFRISADVLLLGSLSLDDDDRARVERVYHAVRCALANRAKQHSGPPCRLPTK